MRLSVEWISRSPCAVELFVARATMEAWTQLKIHLQVRLNFSSKYDCGLKSLGKPSCLRWAVAAVLSLSVVLLLALQARVPAMARAREHPQQTSTTEDATMPYDFAALRAEPLSTAKVFKKTVLDRPVCDILVSTRQKSLNGRHHALARRDNLGKMTVSDPWARAFVLNPRTLVAVFLRPTTFLDLPKTGTCRVGNDRRSHGNITDMHGSEWRESHGQPWDVFIVFCKFKSPVLRASNNRKQRVRFFFGDKSAKSASALVTRTSRKRPFRLTLCAPPLHGLIHVQWIREWLAHYRQTIGVEHFFMYTAFSNLCDLLKISEAGRNILREAVSIIDMSSTRAYETHYFSQSLAIYDCLFLNSQLRTEWTIFQDYDEVLWVPKHWRSPLHFLLQQESYDTVTFGSWFVDQRTCTKESNKTLMERMVKMFEQPHGGVMAESWRGRRKYAVRPTRVHRISIHHPVHNPEQTRTLEISEGHFRHFYGVTMACMDICKNVLQEETLPNIASAHASAAVEDTADWQL